LDEPAATGLSAVPGQKLTYGAAGVAFTMFPVRLAAALRRADPGWVLGNDRPLIAQDYNFWIE
jgi:hypothetical protein